jgi:hypothetical protein
MQGTTGSVQLMCWYTVASLRFNYALLLTCTIVVRPCAGEYVGA